MKNLIINEKMQSIPLDEQSSILYYPSTRVIHVFDSIGQSIINICDGTKNIQNIKDAMREIFEGDKDQIESDVDSFIKELLEKGILLEV